MTFIELLKNCSSGQLPEVMHEKNGIGRVVTIKDNGRHRGCAVKFSKFPYDTWFHDSESNDRRSLYLRDLNLWAQ